jgi:hypothetical protein
MGVAHIARWLECLPTNCARRRRRKFKCRWQYYQHPVTTYPPSTIVTVPRMLPACWLVHCSTIASLFYMTIRLTLHSHPFTWWQAACSRPFRFTLNRVPHVLVHYIAFSVSFLLTAAKKALERFLRHAHTRHIWQRQRWLRVEDWDVKRADGKQLVILFGWRDVFSDTGKCHGTRGRPWHALGRMRVCDCIAMGAETWAELSECLRSLIIINVLMTGRIG